MQTKLVEHDHAAYSTGLPHRVYEPAVSGPRPAVVMIHGRHGTEDVPWIFARVLPKDWLLISPRAIEVEPETDDPHDVGYSWLMMEREPVTKWPHLDEFEGATTALHDFVRALPETYGADPRRIYMLGFSQGAAAAYATALEYPGLVQGIAGLVGFVPDVPDVVQQERPLAGMPIFTAVGKEDDRIPLKVARLGRQRLAANGADVAYHEYEVGHKLNAQGMRDLKAWWQARVNE